MPSNAYRSMHHRQSLITTPLSHESEKLARLPYTQFVEGIQGLPVNRFLQDRTSTAQSWAYKVKIETSLPERTGALFDQARKSLLNPMNLATQQACRKIAELGAANETLLYAQEWLDCLREIAVGNQMWWREPLINLGINSEIVFEWWHENKKLSIYILDNTLEYIQVWGLDIDHEMKEGLVKSSAELASLWEWLAM